MQSQLYPYARELFATAQLSWVTGVWRGLLLPVSYVPNFSNQFLSNISQGVRVMISEEITGKAATNGICSGNHVKFPLLFDNRFISQALIFRDTGDESTSPLVAYIGDEDLVNDPFQGLGLDYYIYPNLVEGGFFRL